MYVQDTIINKPINKNEIFTMKCQYLTRLVIR